MTHLRLSDGQSFTVNRREYVLGTVNGYRERSGLEPKDDHYAYVIATATVIDGNRERAAHYARLREAMPKLDWYDVIEVDGLGLHTLCPPNPPGTFFLDGDHPVLIPLTGQNASPQAAKRLRRSAAADGKRPMPVYDNS